VECPQRCSQEALRARISGHMTEEEKRKKGGGKEQRERDRKGGKELKYLFSYIV